MNTVEGIGYLAASLVFATFCMKSHSFPPLQVTLFGHFEASGETGSG